MMRLRKPNRLKYFDYSNAGWYYVTICTNYHKHFFCKINKDEVILNKTGNIVNESWGNIAKLHQNIGLDYYIIMINHIHGIIIINHSRNNVADKNSAFTADRTKMELCKLIRQFKRSVTIKSTKRNPNFKWQRPFYDRIIRNEKEFYNIRKYIEQNPLKWYCEKELENLDI